MKIIDTFILKDGRKVDIVLPGMDGLQAITDFVNHLIDEDTYLTFTGKHISLEMEKNWLDNALREIKFKKNYIIWAKDDEKIIGSVNIIAGRSARDAHIGMIGLMVDKNYRRGGLGKYLLERIIIRGKKMKLRMAQLDVYDDNEPAIKLYKKFGFSKYGLLPNGLYRKGKYSDKIEMYREL